MSLPDNLIFGSDTKDWLF